MLNTKIICSKMLCIVVRKGSETKRLKGTDLREVSVNGVEKTRSGKAVTRNQPQVTEK